MVSVCLKASCSIYFHTQMLVFWAKWTLFLKKMHWNCTHLPAVWWENAAKLLPASLSGGLGVMVLTVSLSLNCGFSRKRNREGSQQHRLPFGSSTPHVDLMWRLGGLILCHHDNREGWGLPSNICNVVVLDWIHVSSIWLDDDIFLPRNKQTFVFEKWVLK